MTQTEFFTLLEEGLKSINAPEEAFIKLDKMHKGDKPKITEKGENILKYMMESPEELYTAQVIGVALQLASKSVSGSMRPLVNFGLVEKVGKNPTVYKLADDYEEIYNILTAIS